MLAVPALLSQTETYPATTTAGRLVSLDVTRGLTIIGMIVVNNPGSWDVVFSVLQHAHWHGFAFVDLGFPAFLFLMGMASAVALLRRHVRGATRRDLVWKACRRSLILLLIGLGLEAFPFVTFDPALGWHEHLLGMRIPGVLQRIALCYLGTALLFIYTRPRTQYVTAAAIIAAYWLALLLVPVPGYGAGQLGPPEATLPAYVDRLLFGTHLYAETWDPEGFLSTFPALVTTLAGLWTGRFLLTPRPAAETLVRLGGAGLCLVALGVAWHGVLPVNKHLWTGSFTALTTGLCLCIYTAFYWLIDVRGHRRLLQPLALFGVNALTVYVLSDLADAVLGLVQVAQPGGAVPLRTYLFEHLFLPLAPPVYASLLYAVAWVVGWFFILLLMHRRGWIIKV